MFIARAVAGEPSSGRSVVERNPQKIAPTRSCTMNMPLLPELGRCLGVRFHKHATPTELINLPHQGGFHPRLRTTFPSAPAFSSPCPKGDYGCPDRVQTLILEPVN